jgi:hypothetical protein
MAINCWLLKIKRFVLLPVVVSVLSTGLVSCAARSALRLEKLENFSSGNDYYSAIKIIQKNPKLYGNTNKLLYYMDLGVLFHYAGNYDSSNSYLLKAADIYDELFAKSVTNEAAALLTNDNIRPYRSRPYEIVMLHELIALNYMSEGNFEEALVETRRTQLLFNEWERKDKKETKYSSDGMFHYLSSIAYDAQGETDNSLISLYKSVEAYQKGPVLLNESIKNYAYYTFEKNDRASDNQLLKITPSVPQENINDLGNGLSEIIVVGYAGKGPVIKEDAWWGTYIMGGLLIVNHTLPDGKNETFSMPAPILPADEVMKAENGKRTEAGTTFHIKFALPEVKPSSSLTKNFTVRVNPEIPGPVNTILINDLDKQCRKNLEDTRNMTMLRTVVRVVLRTIAAQKAKERMQTSSPFANLLINVGTDILADQLEKADTRSCFLMPGSVQIARIPVKPGTYSVEVAANSISGGVLGSRVFENIKVSAHEKKIIFYSSLK